MTSLRLLSLFLLALVLGAPDAHARSLRPPIVWLKGEGNFTKAHRGPQSIDRIVVHVTEGAFWGSVRWLKSPRAHASSHYVVSRRGKVVQLVHLSDVAWHAGNWNVNVRSIGIEHEGFTYGRAGFTAAQYRNSARLTAWIARRSLMPIDRAHIIGHHEVPGPRGGRGGASHHTDPGRRWNWNRYLALVRSYAIRGWEKLSVSTRLPSGPLRGVVTWRAPTTGGVRSVEFAVDERVAWTDRQAPFTFRGGRGLNTTRLRNGTHVFELRAYGDGTRHDITRWMVVVSNAEFTLTSAGARPWTRVRGTVRLRARPAGAKADRVLFAVDGRRVALD
nr:N-acetylmuramoyl-L-alanine amidase [Actinomycetota bacterium]